MLVPVLPENESARIVAVRSLALLDTAADERFDGLARLAKKVFSTGFSALSLVDSDRVWFKSADGLPFSETPRTLSFCAHAILQDTALIVPDASEDERFHDNPVRIALGIRFYAGCPLTLSDGSRVGVFCIFDTAPRGLSQEEQGFLRVLADIVVMAIEGDTARTRLMQEQQALRESESLLALAIEGSGTGIWDRDLQACRIDYSAGWKAIFGYDEHDLTDLMDDSLSRVHPEDREKVEQAFQAHIDQLTESYASDFRVRCKDGRYKWVASRGKVVARDADGVALRMIGTTSDIDAIQNMSEQLQETVDLITSLTHEVPGLVFQMQMNVNGDVYFSYASAGIADIYELTQDDVNGSDLSIRERIHPDDLFAYEESLARSAISLTPWNLEYRVVLPRQGTRWRQGAAHPRRLGSGGVLWHGLVNDITEPKQIERELRELARVDFLTQLPNRRHFMNQIQQEMARIHQGEVDGAAVMMCDLDYFKAINDSWGHAAGDMALQHFASLFHEEVSDCEALGRVGGEEFAVVFRGVNMQAAVARAKRLQGRIVATPLVYGERHIWLTVSIGISIMKASDTSADQALMRSDMALYRAKGNGRNRIECDAGE